MAKLIKALKKLTTLRSKPAQAAKKAASSKKKTQAAPAAKKAEKPKKSAAAAAPKGKSAKPAPKGKAAAAPKVVAKAVEKKADKKGSEPKKALAAAPAKGTAKAVVEAKSAKGAKAEAPPKKDKAAEKAAAKAAQETVETVKGAKGRKKADEAPAQAEPEEEIVLLDADGRRYCRVKDCDQASMVEGYCRYHYLLFWKNIQVRKKILTEGKLERYIEELTARYPDKYLDMLKKDLRSEKEFLAAIQELEIDEAAVDGDFEDEAQNYLDEVRGMGSEPAAEREDDF
ncbi:MAG: hypothetical protein V4760_03380 [Bdellovibrionota bacterium]